MMLVLALGLMTVAVVGVVLLPLLRAGGRVPERAAFDRAVYRDQLRELERDLARGLIDAREAAGARLEIERRLLATDRPTSGPLLATPSPTLGVALALLLPALAAALYLWLGAPGIPDQPWSARAPERARMAAAAGGHGDLEKTAAALRERLTAAPENAEGWLLLARTEGALGHWQASADAYARAQALTQLGPEVLAAYGEMLILAADGVVTPRAREVLEAAVAREPKNAPARYYLALAQAQAGEVSAALAAWQALAAEQPADSPIRAELAQRIAETARGAGLPVPSLPPPAAAAAPAGPDAGDIAKLPPDERQAMIRGMVEGLAAKLRDHPDDLEGWLKLGRAYGVLGEREKAADAYEAAAKLKPGDVSVLLAEAEMLLPDHAPQTPVPERAVAIFKRIEALDAKQPTALWYLGLAAAQQRRFPEASGYWQRLATELPEGSNERQAVLAALDALKGK